MPALSVFLVRAALAHLVAGSVLGALLLAAKSGTALPASISRTWPLHGELMLVGWAVQLALGVAYWILPKHPHAPVRGRPWPVAGSVLLINTGVLLAGLGPLVGASHWIVAGRVAEATAVGLFAMTAWPRIKGFGR